MKRFILQAIILFFFGCIVLSCEQSPDYGIIEDVYTDSTSSYIIHFHYPKLSLSDKKVSDKINADFRVYVKQEVQLFKEGVERLCERGDFDFEVPADLQVHYNILRQSDTLSLRFSLYYTWPGPILDDLFFKSFNFDLSNGQAIDVQNWAMQKFGGEDVALSILSELNAKHTGKQTQWFKNFWVLEKTWDDFANFNFTDKSVVFIYDNYILGEYASGSLQVEIPNSEINRVRDSLNVN